MTRTPQRQLGTVRVLQSEPAIQWGDYDRISPGIYPAYCRWARHYHDPGLRRWTCLLRFDVLSEDSMRVVARVPLWMNLGEHERPHAGRRSRYFREWIRANGRPPARRDRLSPTVFVRRMARVEIADTKGEVPYSKVLKILAWETGQTAVTQSASHTVKDGSGKQHKMSDLQENDGKRIWVGGSQGVRGAGT
jgi:hypothetical protein